MGIFKKLVEAAKAKKNKKIEKACDVVEDNSKELLEEVKEVAKKKVEEALDELIKSDKSE